MISSIQATMMGSKQAFRRARGWPRVCESVPGGVARRRGASRVPQTCPKCVRLFDGKTTTDCRFAGTLTKPSDGLEPSTPCGVNAGGVAWRCRARASGRAGGPTGVGCDGVSWSGGGFEGDCVPECFELFDESAGAVFGGVAAGEPVGAEFAEGDAVGDDVVVGDQD